VRVIFELAIEVPRGENNLEVIGLEVSLFVGILGNLGVL
jgi:hypothetical protein